MIGHYDSGCIVVAAAKASRYREFNGSHRKPTQEMRSVSSALCRTRDCFANFRSGCKDPMAIQNQASSVRK
jgi:hypothetical protein